MKKIYSIIAMMILFSTINAQIITFPDANFKAKLLTSSPSNAVAKDLSGNWFTIDANNDGQIQVSEALNVSYLFLDQGQITDVTGIKSFSNLETFSSKANHDINQLDLSNMAKLKNIKLEFHRLKGINTLGCPLLETFYMGYNNEFINNLNFTQNPGLKKVEFIYNSRLGNADFSNLPILEELRIMDNESANEPYFNNINLSNNLNLKNLLIDKPNLIALTLNPLPQLRNFTLRRTKLTSLDVSTAKLLKQLTIDTNSNLTTLNFQTCTSLSDITLKNNIVMTNLNVSNMPSLLYLYARNNNISSLNFSGTSHITNLSLSGNAMASVDLSPITDLSSLSMEENITTLDVSKNPNLTTIMLYSPTIVSINGKNGNPNFGIGVSSLGGLNNLAYICCDADRYNDIRYTLDYNGYQNVEVNSYCSLTPGGTTYTVLGNVKYDSNNNGCDASDLNKGLQRFNITDIGTARSIISNNTGNYLTHLYEGSYTITPVLENPSYFNISPVNFTANLSAATPSVNQNFYLTANGTHHDLEAFIIPISSAVPGSTSKYKIIYKNKGTTTQSGNINFNFDNNLMSYSGSTVTPNSQFAGLLNWNFTNLLPFETKEIILTFNLNTASQTPPLQTGNNLNYKIQINGASDDSPSDNLFALNQAVVNSYTPNDKICLEGASISQTQAGNYVHYLIRFKNTGNANVHNVAISDVIDTSKFDITTLVPLDASHSFVTKITNPNIVEFIFENIQLPFDDNHNDGYIAFKIKTKSTLVSGNNFSNTAKIYFDYKAPVVTNTYTTSIEGTLGTSEISNEKKNTINIYPNPVKDILYIKSSNEVTKAEIYDTAGRVINSMGVKENTVNVSDLPKGNYLIKLFLKDKVSVQKFIKE
ncbi:MAG: DUF7619 domain-containing protein [Chryseobacterium jejuense]|uniref:DUF7619 domain-containing protein n=1 Tax=Chryseobacterium jejuense TaxID=445960 RepID=UPI003D0A3C2F